MTTFNRIEDPFEASAKTLTVDGGQPQKSAHEHHKPQEGQIVVIGSGLGDAGYVGHAAADAVVEIEQDGDDDRRPQRSSDPPAIRKASCHDGYA